MCVVPLQQIDFAEVALCLVKESATLGHAIWTLLDYEAPHKRSKSH